MNRHRYKIGDRIVLKDRPAHALKSAGTCKILAVLPESQGFRQYRVRFETENYDRMISEDDIDAERSLVPDSGRALSHPSKGKETWPKGSNVRTVR